jgi:tetratricopeptide (TPR) repeat protein
MFWPFHLAIVYPYPGYFSFLFATAALLMIVLTTVFTLMAARQYPYLVVGWLWYLGTLIPVIGIVQVGYQSMADRYTYIPLIGIFVMLVWGLSSLFGRRPSGRYLLIPTSAAIIFVLMWASWIQAGYWKNSITLFSHSLEVTKNNYIAQNNLGVALYNDGNIEGSIRHYHEALYIKPDYETARNNLVIALIRKEKYEDAIAQCRELLRLTPNYAQAHYNLGLALSALGKTDDAIREYSKAIELNPMDAEAHNNLGVALASQGKFAESSSHFRKALRINPGLAKARTNLDRSLQGLKPNP